MIGGGKRHSLCTYGPPAHHVSSRLSSSTPPSRSFLVVCTHRQPRQPSGSLAPTSTAHNAIFRAAFDGCTQSPDACRACAPTLLPAAACGNRNPAQRARRSHGAAIETAGEGQERSRDPLGKTRGWDFEGGDRQEPREAEGAEAQAGAALHEGGGESANRGCARGHCAASLLLYTWSRMHTAN